MPSCGQLAAHTCKGENNGTNLMNRIWENGGQITVPQDNYA